MLPQPHKMFQPLFHYKAKGYSTLLVYPFLLFFLLSSFFFLGNFAAAQDRQLPARSDQRFSATQIEKRVPQSQLQIQNSFAPIVKNVVPSVVNVYAKKYVRSRGRLSPLFDDPLFRQFFGDNFGGQENLREQQSLGSGVIVKVPGLVVTNYHVIEGAKELRVVLYDRREYKAELILADERTDLAVLSLIDPPQDLQALEFTNSDIIEVGDLVLAVGNPFGVGQTVTSGIISALARTQLGISDYQSFIQTDAAINPGNSGGALVTLDGQLLGINTAIFSRSGGSVGIGFAIPANMVAQVVRAAEGGGKIIRPWLGASFQDIDHELAQALNLPRPQGALILSLHPNSPLKLAGADVGDVVIKIDGQDIFSKSELRYRIGTRDIGGRAIFDIRRQTKPRRLLVDLLSAPETPPRNQTTLFNENAGPLRGLRIANLNPALIEELSLDGLLDGVIVTGIQRGSQAARFGFRLGDILRVINEVEIKQVAEVERLSMSATPHWQLEILRNGRVIRATIR